MKYPKLHNFNEMFTPPVALDYIERFLPRDVVYWEACYGQGHLARELEKRSFKVIGDPEMDCLISQPSENWDILITNPPFNGNKVFIERAIKLSKPFIFLIRLEHLGGVKALELFQNLDIKIIIPERRINYITPNGGKSSPFHSIWLTYGINLPKQINYIKQKR